MTQTGRQGRALPWTAAVVLLGVLGWYVGSDGFGGETSSDRVRGASVRRGPLRISVLQRGNLSAKNSARMVSEIEGRSTIIYMIPEGSRVEMGDLVAELDASSLEDRRVGQEIAVESERSALTKAQQNLQIQRSQNTSDVARAEQQLAFARSDLQKYEEGDWPGQLQEAQEAIVLAEEELTQAQDRLEWSKRLNQDGFLTGTKLKEDTLRHQAAEIRLEQARRSRSLLIEFDRPKQLALLGADVEETQRELERVRLQAAARLVDFEAGVRTSTQKLRLEEEKLAKILQQIGAARMLAPEAGMVVYGRTEGRHGRSGDPIAEGTEVRERQEIATIPRAGGMIVEAELHESVLKKVQEGQRCIVRVDALPAQEFGGVVAFVAHLPDTGSWWANPNQRLYRTEVSIEKGTQEMRPGMSCSVEIVVDEIADALYVPVQAVLLHRGQTICFVDDGGLGAEREVQVGASSAEWVQVLAGLEEGEVVLLSPPPGFLPAPAPEGDEPAGEGAQAEAPAGPRHGPGPEQRRPDGERRAPGDRPGGRPPGAGKQGRGRAPDRTGDTSGR